MNSVANSTRQKVGFFLALGVLAVLETAWLVWYLASPLPNAGNVGGVIRRWIFAAKALPHVIPGVRFDQSYLGLSLSKLSHLEVLPQRIPIVLAGALITGAAVCLGLIVLRVLRVYRALTRWERLPLAFGLGMTGLGIVTLVLGRMGWLSPWIARSGLAVVIAAEAVCFLAGFRTRNTSPPAIRSGGLQQAVVPWVGFVLVAGPFLLIMALGSMLPTIDYDSIAYHLQGPKEYYQAGRITFLPHNVYTSMPFNIEMLHLLGMEVLDDWWAGALVGQLLIALHAPAAAAMIALTALRLGSPRAAWVGSVVYLTTPWIYRIAAIPYVEGPLCYYHAALIWVASRSLGRARPVEDPPSLQRRCWAIAGLLAGGAMGCKYPGLISSVIPFGLVALIESIRSRSGWIVLAFALGWAVVMSPWLAKNVIDTGNPVYPLGYRVFGGTHWEAGLDAKWSNVHGPRPRSVKLLVESILEVAGGSDWQSPLYVALAPLALLRRGTRRVALILWGYVVYLFATWWLMTHRVDRFWLPILPPIALLAGLGADWVRSRLWTAGVAALMSLAIVTSFAYCSTELAGLNEWTGDYRALLRGIPNMLNSPLVRLDETLPPDAKVLLVGQAGVFYVRHPVVYNTVFNHETIETLTRDRSPQQIRDEFRRLGVTHVYVDWVVIERFRSPGNYGFTDYVTPGLFTKLVADGVLESPQAMGSGQDLYTVRMNGEAQGVRPPDLVSP